MGTTAGHPPEPETTTQETATISQPGKAIHDENHRRESARDERAMPESHGNKKPHGRADRDE
ncbi:hypothetical protein PWY87_25225 [Kribbella solani]|uniref:hypothetical protein n=1 Tax=Kribbella solani TaxID=236067 RepID=UPI0029AE7B78|nr:hypothetical protein [Kribbella solani]MDX3005003.1 hypothetical protein [Kribbella solani]